VPKSLVEWFGVRRGVDGAKGLRGQAGLTPRLLVGFLEGLTEVAGRPGCARLPSGAGL
jgi:hypothetical protein